MGSHDRQSALRRAVVANYGRGPNPARHHLISGPQKNIVVSTAIVISAVWTNINLKLLLRCFIMSNKKQKIDSEHRVFKDQWEDDYFCIE
ncbi:general transcription factor II-I repeat domain-containing protein 2-like [Aphis craccivora]|uniref:General transcription factor II-I repeat domain-containing protein 2-like n=1 Tax=Aphis craccivora TaxID=307492 RepID=A0A6G0Y4P5_APHCR|nr:general transcription factor II-I repeat domain-containing protein 2-like [Aphis craccivora]